MTKQLQVGIVGASADRGWAKISHVPAVQQLAGLELGAVVSGNQAKSDTAAKAFGAKAAYGDARDLFRDPNIDIVSICVKVPDHRELVLGALAAGKHVYCEWPLGRDLAESEELAAAAQAAGVHVAIGLQTRMNPAAQRGRDSIGSGTIGRPLSARILSTTARHSDPRWRTLWPSPKRLKTGSPSLPSRVLIRLTSPLQCLASSTM